MKNQFLKKLSAFIIITIMFSCLTEFANAQCSRICKGTKSKCVLTSMVQSYHGWHLCGTCHSCISPIRLANEQTTVETISVKVNPNPISGSSIISFSLEQSEKVSLKLFDFNGRLIENLADKIFEEGENELAWNTANVNAGLYILQFQSAENLQTEKIIVTK